MEPGILFAAIIAIVAGFLEGIDKNKNRRKQVKPSSNLVNFIFIDPFTK